MSAGAASGPWRDGKPAVIATYGVGDRPQTRALTIADGKLLLGGYCSLEGATFCAVRFGLSCTMDVDGDGSVLSTSDALILTRVSLGMTGNAVINGINFPAAATRRTWTAIRDHLANTCGMALAP